MENSRWRKLFNQNPVIKSSSHIFVSKFQFLRYLQRYHRRSMDWHKWVNPFMPRNMTETLAYGTHLTVLSESYLMNTNMTGFKCFSKFWTKVDSALEELNPSNLIFLKCFSHLFSQYMNINHRCTFGSNRSHSMIECLAQLEL